MLYSCDDSYAECELVAPTEPDTRAPLPRLVAIVVTHDRLAALRKTVERLLAIPEAQLAAVIVVDNASRDGTGAWLQALGDPRLRVCHQAMNLGGAGGFAAGLDHARRTLDPDWFVLMDDDARPVPGAIARFHAQDLDAWDAFAAAAYHATGAICEINRPTRDPFATWAVFLRTLRAGREGFHLDRSAYAGAMPIPIDGASFVGLFLSRRALRMAGLPDRDLFIYADDAIQTLRLSRAGGRLAFAPAIRFEHDIEGREGPGSTVPLWKVYYLHRNSLILYRQAAGGWFWMICLIVIPRWAARARAYPGRRRAFARLFARGVWDGLQRRTDVAHETVLAWAARSS